jgi:hypothetical protein
VAWKRTKQTREDATVNDSASSSRPIRSFVMVAVSLNITPISTSSLFRKRTVPKHFQIQIHCIAEPSLSFPSWLVSWGWLANTVLLSVKISHQAYSATLVYVGRCKHFSITNRSNCSGFSQGLVSCIV